MTEPTTTDVNTSFETGLDEAEREDEGMLFLYNLPVYVFPLVFPALRRQLEVKSFIAYLKKVFVCIP